MDCKSLGTTIAHLRHQNDITQSTLADALGVSNKAVSKWESGQGFPDISLLPTIAEFFGVSIDYLLLGEKKGITIAGNMIMDVVKNIEQYPTIGMLVSIGDVSRAVGGCAPNTSINLAKIDRRVPISVIGKVGTDENGRYIVSELQKNGINVSRVSYSSTTPTSFCDVMSIPSGERTFFHKRGANAEFSPADIDLDSLDCNILHIGYILLLDKFDAEDKQYGTVMARFLHDVQKKGIKTSIDVVSDSTGDFPKKLIPALPYCNYVIINEIECCNAWNLEAYKPDGTLDRETVALAMQKMIDGGVSDRVIVHCKKTSFALDNKGNFTEVPSLRIPKELIRGSVGAGDAFCAGCLYGIYNDYTDRQILEFASAAAACNLFEANSVDGMRPRNEILKIAQKYGRITE